MARGGVQGNPPPWIGGWGWMAGGVGWSRDPHGGEGGVDRPTHPPQRVFNIPIGPWVEEGEWCGGGANTTSFRHCAPAHPVETRPSRTRHCAAVLKAIPGIKRGSGPGGTPSLLLPVLLVGGPARGPRQGREGVRPDVGDRVGDTDGPEGHPPPPGRGLPAPKHMCALRYTQMSIKHLKGRRLSYAEATRSCRGG